MCQKLAAACKVKQIQAMPRSTKKQILKTVYQTGQGFVNCNLRAFGKATLIEQMKLVSNTMFAFKVGLFSTISSGLLGKVHEMMQ